MSGDQQFCLRWNNHQATLMSTFESLLLNETLVDVTLVAEGKPVLAHKVVLSACSPYFENICTRFYDKHPVIVLKDVRHRELRALLDYMYKGELNISQEHLGSLLKTAESLKIKGLADSGGADAAPAERTKKQQERTVSPIPKKQRLSPVTLDTIEKPRSALTHHNNSNFNERESDRGEKERGIIVSKQAASSSSPGEAISPAGADSDEFYQQEPLSVEPKAESAPDASSRPGSVVKEEVLDDDMPLALDDESSRYEGTDEELTLDPGPSTAMEENAEGSSAWQFDGGGELGFNFPGSGGTHVGDTKFSFRPPMFGGFGVGPTPPHHGALSAPHHALFHATITPMLEDSFKKFACPKCGKRYVSKQTMKRHLKYECGTEPKFACEICEKKFTHKFNMKSHMLMCHKRSPANF